MQFFFKPRGIALVGASANPAKGGHTILANLMRGFKGAIHPVNPRYDEIAGLTCYPSVLDVPEPVDIAIIFVGAEMTLKAVQQCARRGLKGVMIQSAGFAESGRKGRQLQAELLAVRRGSGMRLWGPNCMGLVDSINRQVFSFVAPSIWDEGLVPGRVSLVVQSGMLSAGFLIDIMTHGTMGISKACSIGNKVDVDECDLLPYLLADPDTGCVGLYLESIADGRRFLDICRRSQKPIVVLKGGKSKKGAAAALSHTASIAGNQAVVSGALAQAGVIEAQGFMQLIDLARALAVYPQIRVQNHPPRIAVLTFSGGAGIVSSDFMDSHGLELADLSETTRNDLQQVFPEWMPASNPVDLWPAIERSGPEAAWGRAFRAVLADPGVDAVFFHVFVGGFSGSYDLESISRMARASRKPVFGWLLGRRMEAHQFMVQARETGIPIFREIQRAVECMAAVFKRGDYLQRRSSRQHGRGRSSVIT